MGVHESQFSFSAITSLKAANTHNFPLSRCSTSSLHLRDLQILCTMKAAARRKDAAQRRKKLGKAAKRHEKKGDAFVPQTQYVYWWTKPSLQTAASVSVASQDMQRR